MRLSVFTKLVLTKNQTYVLYDAFPNNPFKMQDLSVVSKTDSQFGDNIVHNLSQLLHTGSNQAVKYITDRLICSIIK